MSETINKIPLSKITSEDASEVGKIIGFDYKSEENGKTFIRHLTEKKRNFGLNFHPNNVIKAFVFLQSKNYDVTVII